MDVDAKSSSRRTAAVTVTDVTDVVDELFADPATTAAVPTAAFALRWIRDTPSGSMLIPGGRTPGEARSNAAAALAPLTTGRLEGVRRIDDERVRRYVHDRW